jgi:hypothetical protein
MKRQWRIHRHFRTATDGAQRWDQVHQHTLEWTQSSPGNGARLPITCVSPAQEEEQHEHGDLCACVDRAANPSPDH